jgi:tRNA G18 (ribose-2'-O)-methylase SpoU
VCVSVPQFGQVECLNVAVAASIAMYEYVSQQTVF